MPFDARVFQIFIASPGDVHEERVAATEVIQQWNDLHSRETSIVLLPLRWETHSSPEFGTRPQAVINRQVLDQCDLVVGIFWTRLGTPSGASASGTVEEIERTGIAGKPVMLYFSNSKVDLETVDLEEYKRLKMFKTKTYPEGLVESFNSLAEFRDKFSRQLTIKIRDLVDHAQKERTKDTTTQTPNLGIVVARSSPNDGDGQSLQILDRIEIDNIICVNENEIPDFDKYSGGDGRSVFVSYPPNREYFRQLVRFYIEYRKHVPCRIAVMNDDVIGISNVALEGTVGGNHGGIVLAESVMDRPAKHQSGFMVTRTRYFDVDSVLQIIEYQDQWKMSMDIRVVQAKRTVMSKNEFFLGALHTCAVDFEFTVYSTASPPFVVHRVICIEVSQRSMTYQEILTELGENVRGEVAVIQNEDAPPA